MAKWTGGGAGFAAVAIAFVAAAACSSAYYDGFERREFEYFALALQWPGTICSRTRHCCSSNGCCRFEALTWFTIHGLWPDYNDGTWPSCCERSEFDINKVSSLRTELEKYWPSLYCSSSTLCSGWKGSIWAHEWEKHGTCSHPVISDELGYFSTALDLYKKHNVTGMLEMGGIWARDGEKYAVKDVIRAIRVVFGASPLLVCKHGSVQEIRLCFSKDFTPRDCVLGSSLRFAMDAHMSNSCPKRISLPTYAPISIGSDRSHSHERLELFDQ